MKMLNRRQYCHWIATSAAMTVVGGLGACAVAVEGRPQYVEVPAYYYDYYYYPHIGVYFHLFSGDYYYWRDGRWFRTRKLPGGIWLDPHYRVQLQIRDEVPYKRNTEHFSRYAKQSDWERDRNRNRSEWERRDRDERQRNISRHFDYHRKT